LPYGLLVWVDKGLVPADRGGTEHKTAMPPPFSDPLTDAQPEE